MKHSIGIDSGTKESMEEDVKNRFSGPTKFQEGQDQCRNDVKSDCQGKALKEGCCEREWAWESVSSTEKMNTKRDLTRVMVKTIEQDADSHYETLLKSVPGRLSQSYSK